MSSSWSKLLLTQTSHTENSLQSPKITHPVN